MGFLDLLATLAGVDFAPLMPDAVRSNIGGLTPDVNRINFSQPGDSAWGGTRLAQGAYGDSGDQLRSRFSGGITELDRLTYRRDNPNAKPTSADELGAIARGEKPPRPQTQPGAQQQQGQPGRFAEGTTRAANIASQVPGNVPDEYKAFIAQAAQQWGVDPALLAAQLRQESGFNPNAVSQAGAQGIAQFIPSTARAYGVDVTSPESSIQGMAHYMSDLLKQYNGDQNAALAAYNGGAGAVNALRQGRPYQETSAYLTNVQNFLGEYRQAAATQPVQQPSPITPTGAPISSGLSQFGQGLSDAEARAACGPAAAAWFAQNFGRNPTVFESMQIAKQGGMWRGQMQGPASEVRLLQQLGVPAQMVAATPQNVANEIQAGRPVIIDTPGHYYQLTAYNPDNGTFRLGDAVGNGRWSTLDDIANLGYGGVRTAIILRQ